MIANNFLYTLMEHQITVSRCVHNRLFAATMLGLLLFGVIINVDADSDPGQKLKQVREKIDALQTDLSNLRDRRDVEQKELRTTEKEIGRLTRNLQDLRLKQEKQRIHLQDLEQQQRQQKETIKQQLDTLTTQLRTAYMTGRQEYLKMFLNQQEPQQIGRILTYYDYFNHARVGHIDQLRTNLADLDRSSVQIEQERHKITLLTEQLNSQKQALNRSRLARDKALAVLKQDIGKGSGRLEQLRKDEQQLAGLLSRLTKARADSAKNSPSPFSLTGNLLPWPVEGSIKAGFGNPRTPELNWKGVLIEAIEGQSVHAILPGKIVFADWLRGYGLLVIIDHGSGYMSLYGYNQSLQKETGTRVESGETIATVGSSGGNEHAGLYFEIRHNGQPVDPAKWCVARK